MADQETQASAVGVSVEDNPSAIEPTEPIVAPEQGSTTGAPAPQEHRDWLEMELEELLVQHPKLKDADPDKLVQTHPGLKGYLARTVKSQSDKAVHRALQARELEEQKRKQADEAQRQGEDLTRFIEQGDEYEVGKWAKEDTKRRREIQPHLNRAYQEGQGVGRGEGYREGQLAELRNTVAVFEEVFPHWKAMTRAEREAYMADLLEPREAIIKIVRDGIQGAIEKHQHMERGKAKREAEIEGRSQEPNPNLGTGGTSGGSLLTQETFDANRGNSAWVRANLGRVQEAMAAGRIRR